MNRVQLDKTLESKKTDLAEVFEHLKDLAGDSFYPSLWAEIRRKKSYVIHRQGQDIKLNETSGVVLRLYDGQTLFEEATDQFDKDVLNQKAQQLVERAKLLKESTAALRYKPASWSERLVFQLEDEIRSQIPGTPNADQWVHFGTRINDDHFQEDEEAMQWSRSQFTEAEKHLASLQADFVSFSLSLQEDHFLFLDSQVRMTQALSRNLSRCVVSKGQESARVDKGGLGGKESFTFQPVAYQQLKQQLEDLLKAERLQPGRYKLLMGPGITGVFAHEAFGHTQEGDTWARGRSKAKELFEQNVRVGNEHATILNNPAIFENGTDSFGAWGSYFFDEEGWLSREQVLVEKGYLKEPMTHLLSSEALNVPRSANGKRENWSRGVYTRQTNTYFSAGDKTLDELIQKVDYGFLAEECAGGMEDPKGMGIQVGIQYVKEIKDGKLTGKTFRGPGGGSLQMTGSVPDYLNQILDKSCIDPTGKNEAAKHPWNDVGGCAKYHKEVVYAGCGGPYMLVDKVLLG